PLQQGLGDLNRVQGGAFEQIVADDPEAELARVRALADPSHVNRRGPRGVEGSRIIALGPEPDARRSREELSRAGRGHRSCKLEPDGERVASLDRYADRGGADGQPRQSP